MSDPYPLDPLPFQNALDNLLEGCQIIDADWRYLYVNPAAARQGRSTPPDLVGRTMPEVYPGIEHTPLFAALRRCLQDGVPVNLENEFVYPYGGSGWFELRLQPVPQGLFIMSVDITERKRAQHELARRQADEKFRGLLEAAPDAIVMVNPDGSILYANSQTEKLFGYERDSLVGANVEQLVPPRFRGRHVSHRAMYFSEPRVRPMGVGLGLYGLRQDGREFPVDISLSPIETADGLLVTAAIRDATERRQMEQALREKNEELENALLARDRFLAGMSHELRTPLNAIIGFTGILLMKLPGPLTAQQEKQLETVRTSARHLLSLINDLLDMARIEAGKVTLDIGPVSCQALVAEVADTLRPLAEAKGLRFAVETPPEAIVLSTDTRSLKQILINLCNNAIKFTPEGQVSLALRRPVGPPAGAGPQRTEFVVADTGPGIAPDAQARLFQAYEQMAAGHRVQPEGTGLGLYLSQRLASLLGGRIEFTSELGRGSVFTLVIEAG